MDLVSAGVGGAIGLIIGILIGYGIRASISRARRRKAAARRF
jgi:hypothetical protein